MGSIKITHKGLSCRRRTLFLRVFMVVLTIFTLFSSVEISLSHSTSSALLISDTVVNQPPHPKVSQVDGNSMLSKINISEIYINVSNGGRIYALGSILAAIQESRTTTSARQAGATTTAEMESFPRKFQYQPPPDIQIDRIYYINLDHRTGRQALTEEWLSRQHDIPYERIPGMSGSSQDYCVKDKNDGGPRCRGVVGISKTNVKILELYNTTGYTLVVEDDFVIRDMNKLVKSIALVPDDWDVIRWDCWTPPHSTFKKYSRPYAFSTGINPDTCPPAQCDYCGGNHVALWNGSRRRGSTDDSLEKLRQVWSQTPYDDVDCRLSDPSLNSYCINIGIGEFRMPLTELTDNPKVQVSS